MSTLSLAFVTWLAVYKAWGVTPRGRRFLRVPAAQGSERPRAAAQRS